MTLRVDDYLVRTFKPGVYTCWEFVNDAWRDLTGFDLGLRPQPGDRVVAVHASLQTQGSGVIEVEDLVDPCVVFFEGGPRVTPHIGVYLRGRVLHLMQTGPKFERIDRLNSAFKSTRMFTCAK